MYKKKLFEKFISFTASVHTTTHNITKGAKPSNISQVQYKILELVSISQPMTPSEINDCLNMSMPNTSRELRLLSEKKLIEKTLDPDDRRKQYIGLSPEGKDLITDAFSIIESRFSDRIQHLSENELQEVDQALDFLQKKLFQ
ncbi:MarR family winged helix-turn-helix transcriptional regulator [Jeotgalibacillus sp. R-1-5s-1]|uniref:MarR family winged helix-turn-helix transcriptional regulator n=1 Tax=Jeotgalibacillus sp. R-1-5s-1 TaxID=2555897 RepID=UPI00106B4788|nr:MarR family transcriptional regulator [Jeotgalibacillus sp. R-1-5s-1]TFD99550.1 MarR family transcriptional regulator [Jeotgalibacillus sp. R-1-5s-1]